MLDFDVKHERTAPARTSPLTAANECRENDADGRAGLPQEQWVPCFSASQPLQSISSWQFGSNILGFEFVCQHLHF